MRWNASHGSLPRLACLVPADLMRTDRHNHGPIAGASSHAEAIKLMAREYQNVIWARNRHTTGSAARCAVLPGSA